MAVETAMNVDRARVVYRSIRNRWIARGAGLEAHERLGLITVAAGLRDFAFLTQLDIDAQAAVAQSLRSLGLGAQPCAAAFDFEIEPDGISVATIDAYTKVQRQRFPLNGLGVWSQPPELVGCAGMASLGSALAYPRCCELMDLRTKQKDHQLFLAAVVEEEGDSPDSVERALQEKRQYAKASYDHCDEWNDRFARTLARFPFVLHTACDDCLRDELSPTATLNDQYGNLAEVVSEELHLMVRWGAQALSYRPDHG